MGNIVGENFNQYVVDQVNLRQKLLGSINRTNQQLVWENSKTAWTKLVSSANLVDGNKKFLPNSITEGYIGGSKLAERFVLFNGTTDEAPNIGSLENYQRSGIGINNAWVGYDAYGLGGSSFGLQPMPGIKSVTIKTETRGTLKTGTVSIRANNKQQFEIINTLYLRLGYMVLLEWGNSCYYDNKGNFIPDNNLSLADSFLSKKYTGNVGTLSGTNVTYNNLLKAVEIQREKSCGNYDALVGKVVNFNWVFNKDGSYDITVIIRSIGDVIEALKVNTLLPGKLPTTSTENPTPSGVGSAGSIAAYTGTGTTTTTPTQPPPTVTGDESSEEIIKAYSQNNTIAKHFAEIQQAVSTGGGDLEGSTESSVYGGMTVYKDKQGIISYFSQKYQNGSDITTSNQYYIRLGTFLQFLEKSIIPTIKDGGRLIDIDTDVTTNRIHTLPNQVSSDPRICVYRKQITFYYGSGIKYELYPEIEDFNGRLMNVYFNLVYILKLLNDLKDKDGKVSIVDLLNTMMTGFCKATGNYNKISTRVNVESNQIVFIDETIIPDRDLYLTNKTPVQFNVYGLQTNETGSIVGGSFIRDLQLKTGITPDLATMITIGATAAGYVTGQDATLISNLNKGTVDRIKPEIIPPLNPKNNSIEANASTNDVYKEAQEAFDDFIYRITPKESVGSYSAGRFTEPEWNEDLYSNFTNTQVQLLEYEQKQDTNNIRYSASNNDIYNPSDTPYASSPNSGFLPFDLNLTMDGISGMKIYQKYFIDSQFLPSNYPETMEFIIKGVSNTIQNNTWVTNIESFAIPRVSKKSKSKAKSPSTPSSGSVVSVPNPQEPNYSNADSDLRKAIVRIATNYRGIKEEPMQGPGSAGFNNANFQAAMAASGWYPSTASEWCNYFTRLVWKQAYNEVSQRDPAIEVIKNNVFKKFDPVRCPINPYVPTTFDQMIKIKFGPNNIFPGAENFIKGKTVIQNGDMVIYAGSGLIYGHIGIATNVNQSGRTYTSIDGNLSGQVKSYVVNMDGPKGPTAIIRVVEPL